MERAIVHLRESKLTDAYEPPQTEALAALLEAKRLVDAQKDKVDNEIDRQQKEAIRQRYVRLKAEQEKLNAETIRIHDARMSDGQLKRADSIALAQLADKQSALSKEIDEIGKDLDSLGSVVFVWANKQIGQQMDEVRPKLAGLISDKPVQVAERQIVRDIDAMIENLKTMPKKDRFEQGGGGGQGGSGGPKVPPEAELRLLKALQQRINDATTDASQQLAQAKGQHDQTIDEELNAQSKKQSQLRSLLDELLDKASQGQLKLGPEPDNLQPLPEEANDAAIDAQELTDSLLTQGAGEDKKNADVKTMGSRMARSRIRLGDDLDPGLTTQNIQKRIQKDFDVLIALAQQQQKSGKSQQQQQQQQAGEQQQQNQAQNQGQNQNPTGTTAAAASTNSAPGGQANAGKDLRETAEEWGRISPRLRGPVLEGRDDTIIERYRRLIEDYTQAVSTEASGAGK
ncbi:MAG: hypothetical protein QM770_13855 [Tepidisphaeraceae bacterium]